MNRFGRLLLIGAVLAFFRLNRHRSAIAGRPHRPPPKFGDRDRAKADPDGRNNIEGAFWKAALVNNKPSEMTSLMHRANFAVLYDGKGKLMGKNRPDGKGQVRRNVGETAILQGELKIEWLRLVTGKEHWSKRTE